MLSAAQTFPPQVLELPKRLFLKAVQCTAAEALVKRINTTMIVPETTCQPVFLFIIQRSRHGPG